MRIRSTKPEFWRSKTIASLPWDVRLVLKGLESYVDDNGVGKDDIELIAADVFSRDLSRNAPETLTRLSEARNMLAEAGLIALYVAEGEQLIYIDRWKDLQRIDKPARGRFPRPDGTFEYSEAVNRDSYRSIRDILANTPEGVAPVTGEQGNRGTEEQGNDISTVSPVTYVPERAIESNSDGLDVFGLELGVSDVDDLRKVLSGTLGHSITSTEALVFAQEIAKLAMEPVTNLTGYVVVACQNNPDQVREWYSNAEVAVKP